MSGKRDTEPISLPLHVHHPRLSGMWLPVLFGLLVWPPLVLSTIGAIAMTGAGQFDPIFLVALPVLLGLAAADLVMFRNAAARRRLGPGTLTVTRSGFRETRLANELIPWSAFNDARPWPEGDRRSGYSGVRLHIDPGAALPPFNEDYGPAVQPGTSLRTTVHLGFFNVDGSDELARRIVGSVRGVEPDLDGARLADPVMPAGPAASNEVERAPRPRMVIPWLSIGLIAVMTLVFTAEVLVPVTPPTAPLQLSFRTAVAFGGVSRTLLLSGVGQGYRLVASGFVHANLTHLLHNCVLLFLAGALLEGVIGRFWFAVVYGVGELAGSAAFLVRSDANTVSIGASGAVAAVVAAALVCSFHYRPSMARHRLQAFALLALPMFLWSETGVDAHRGGALAGALVALVLLRGWTQQAAYPPRPRIGMAPAFWQALPVRRPSGRRSRSTG